MQGGFCRGAGDHLGTMDETVDQGDDACGVREDIGPFREGLVGGHECGAVLISAPDQLEQQIGVAVTDSSMTRTSGAA